MTEEPENSAADPIALLFGGMGKLGPGDDRETIHVLRSLPRETFELVVDAGCGTGRQTLALVDALRSPVHALDTYEPFLTDLTERAHEAGVGEFVKTRCLDIEHVAREYQDVDLLWSEGSAYNIGFAHALESWAPALADGGFLVVSELCWLTEDAPAPARDFFAAGYPDMKTVAKNVEVAEAAGYTVLGTHALPRESWTVGFYDVLRPRAAELATHDDETVRQFADEMHTEIEVFDTCGDSYGYVFLALERS